MDVHFKASYILAREQGFGVNDLHRIGGAQELFHTPI